MTLIIKSNQVYTGNRKLKNIINYVVTDTQKADYVKSALSSFGVTDFEGVSTAAIFDKFIEHQSKVNLAGGTVLSIPLTIKAIYFKDKYVGVGENSYVMSPALGVRLAEDGTVDTIYGLDADTYKPQSATVRVSEFNGKPAIMSTSATSKLHNQGDMISFSNGGILGANMGELSPSGSTSYISAPRLMRIESGTDVGSIGDFTYLDDARLVLNLNDTTYSATLSYYNAAVPNLDIRTISEEYNGVVVGTLSETSGSQLYLDGELKTSRPTPSTILNKNHRIETIINNAGSGYLCESWVIDSSDLSLAEKLSTHLA